MRQRAQTAKEIRGLLCRHHVFGFQGQPVPELLQHRQHQFRLGIIIAVDRALADPGAAGNFLHPGPVETVIHEDGPGRFQYGPLLALQLGALGFRRDCF